MQYAIGKAISEENFFVYRRVIADVIKFWMMGPFIVLLPKWIFTVIID